MVAIIANHLLPLVWDMRCHGRKPIESIAISSFQKALTRIAQLISTARIFAGLPP